ncbi:MAG TPA: GNAT family N-acetyltransferase [Pyrinomonadaceae bacterium]|nr:GNAT family N-acetyltransferase [Pyrinomonadaceae bacterium]
MSSTPGSSPSTIVIRDLETLDEMHEVEELQREIWGVSDLDVYPALALRPQKEVGAILMGAFTEGRMVGFVFGFPGIFKGETIIHSDMLGVTSEYRSHGLGYLLKCAQRDAALDRGIRKITWTFDPLQSRNAHLNFGKLGVIADRYLVNYYGETSSFLHRSGTDRLWVTWVLDSERVAAKIERHEMIKAPELNFTALVRVGQDGEPVVNTDMTDEKLIIEIPGEVNAEAWREPTRAAFTAALDAGYTVSDFFMTDRKIGVYLLTAS